MPNGYGQMESDKRIERLRRKNSLLERCQFWLKQIMRENIFPDVPDELYELVEELDKELEKELFD
ncbi:MAG: hypothetical protein ACYTFW_00165 [Planctomycetota bacterium]|jgi:hypothetical protein